MGSFFGLLEYLFGWLHSPTQATGTCATLYDAPTVTATLYDAAIGTTTLVLEDCD